MSTVGHVAVEIRGTSGTPEDHFRRGRGWYGPQDDASIEVKQGQVRL
jgi:hypothetical protein